MLSIFFSIYIYIVFRQLYCRIACYTITSKALRDHLDFCMDINILKKRKPNKTNWKSIISYAQAYLSFD